MRKGVNILLNNYNPMILTTDLYILMVIYGNFLNKIDYFRIIIIIKMFYMYIIIWN